MSAFWQKRHLRLQPTVAMEKERLRQRIHALLEQERRRRSFRVVGVELRRTVSLAEHTIEARLDRLDEDDQGRMIVIDYKTGAARPSAWLQPRPEDVQVPLYTLAVGAVVGLEALFAGPISGASMNPAQRSPRFSR